MKGVPQQLFYMLIELKPEIEALIEQDVARLAYQSAVDFVEQAVALLHEQEKWLLENRAEIVAKLKDAYASIERGHLVDEEDLRLRLAERKRAWLTQSRPRAEALSIHPGS